MFVDSKDTLATAKSRIKTGPVPIWSVPCEFDIHFKGKQGDQITYLLLDRQIHAEDHQTFFRTAIRLETMQAVQHSSQWQREFEPRTQSITLHWIKTRRGNLEFDHTNLERLRLLEREAGLEGFVIDGWFTLLLILDDIRPGDVIESCYTIEERPRLLPKNCASFFGLPVETSIGKFSFSLQFRESRPMKWKSSSEDLKPIESQRDGDVLWTWTAENRAAQKREVNTPEWHISYPWIQVSDCVSWETVAAAVFQAWHENEDDPTLAGIAQEIADKESDTLLRIGKAIQLIQDEYRYLSVNLEVGGQIPTAPGIVARRRFGDCKDLSFLLVHILKRLGVSARPMLVNTQLRRTVVNMLPMAGLFNHAVVEFQVDGETRWVDATMKYQGGNTLDRFIPNYGFGLPVTLSSDLVKMPYLSVQAGAYELKESVLLDTTGAPSAVAVVLRATGNHAERLRERFDTMGEEEFAKERAQIYTNRFFSAKRIGPLKSRDDRATNEFFVAEVFEINGFLTTHHLPGMCGFPFPNNLAVTTLQMPDSEPRRTPFALPHPCNIVHTIEVETPSVQPMGGPRSGFESRFVKFNRREKSLYGYWATTFTFCTLTDSVPNDCIDDYRKMIEKIWHESSGGLIVPVGFARPRINSSFGQLPPPSKPSIRTYSHPKATSTETKSFPGRSMPTADSVEPPLRNQTTALAKNAGPDLTPERPRTSQRSVKKRQKRRESSKSKELWLVAIAGVMIIGFGIFVYWISRNP